MNIIYTIQYNIIYFINFGVFITNVVWNSGYILDYIKYGNGKWIGVFSKNIDNKSQKYHETGRWTDMHDVISKEWEKGFYLTKILNFRT